MADIQDLKMMVGSGYGKRKMDHSTLSASEF